MKHIFFIIVFTTLNLKAYEGFRCIPSMRDTRIQVLVQEKTVEVLVTNPMGYEFMPQFEPPGTAYNIAFNKMQAEDLKDLGDQFSYSWPKENCQVDSQNFKVTCQSEAQAAVKTVKAYGITTTEVTEKYEGDTYNKRKFRLSLEKDNMYFVSLFFDAKNCEAFSK